MYSVIERCVMKGIKAKPEKQDLVLARVKAGECLNCGNPGRLRRGQCPSCYSRFRRQLICKPKAVRAELERSAIHEGILLEVRQARGILFDDPIAELFAEKEASSGGERRDRCRSR